MRRTLALALALATGLGLALPGGTASAEEIPDYGAHALWNGMSRFIGLAEGMGFQVSAVPSLEWSELTASEVVVITYPLRRLDPARLQAYGLSFRDVYDAVARNNANVGGGYIEHGPEQYALRGVGLAESTDDLARVVVKTGSSGVPVFVGDLGEVATGGALRQGAVTAQGNGEIVAGIAIMLLGENSRAVVDRAGARGFEHLFGAWPGERDPDRA